MDATDNTPLPPITPRILSKAEVDKWVESLPVGECWDCGQEKKLTRNGLCIRCKNYYL